VEARGKKKEMLKIDTSTYLRLVGAIEAPLL
jgi:hypothetical protein